MFLFVRFYFGILEFAVASTALVVVVVVVVVYRWMNSSSYNDGLGVPNTEHTI